MVTSFEGLLELFSTGDTTGNLETTSNPGSSKFCSALRGRDHGTTTLGVEEGDTMLSYNGADTFNSIYNHIFLSALAKIVPSLKPYARNLYVR